MSKTPVAWRTWNPVPDTTLNLKDLAAPLRWSKHNQVRLGEKGDLFDNTLTNEQIATVFGVMATTPHITYQVLTKYATRMRAWFGWVDKRAAEGLSMFPNDTEEWRVGQMLHMSARRVGAEVGHAGAAWPLPNVWLGVSVENQATADERIPDLLATPAAVRFLSLEPLLGPLDLHAALWKQSAEGFAWPSGEPRGVEYEASKLLHWIITGCESGSGARPCNVEWLRSLRDQCKEAAVTFFLKQARESAAVKLSDNRAVSHGRGAKYKAGGVIELPYLDGVQHMAMPGDHL